MSEYVTLPGFRVVRFTGWTDVTTRWFGAFRSQSGLGATVRVRGVVFLLGSAA